MTSRAAPVMLARMSSITNLTRFRKQKARAEKRRQGDANAARFGRTLAERARDAEETARAARHLDQHQLDQDRREPGGAGADD